MANFKIVSRETIKPSSPTPESHLNLQLSLLDQLSPPMHTPLILFYSAQGDIQKSDRLKKSLSNILTCFYPFAGRIKQDDASGYIHVECNDEGVEFYEAKVDGELSEFSTTESNRFLLLPPLESSHVPLIVQLSIFNCGGSAIGVYLSHQIADGASLATFIKSWADASRIGGEAHKMVSPIFGFASVFYPRSMRRPKVMQEILISKKKTVAIRLFFDKSKISLLREKIRAIVGLFPTRVEAVSALIWGGVLRARGVEALERKPMALHSVNIRRRMEPPLPEYSIGNLVIPAFVTGERVVDDRSSDRLGYLVGRLREEIEKVKGDNAKEILQGDGDMLLSKSSRHTSPEKWEELGIDFLLFSSWCRFPFYESDFGWGKPEEIGFITNIAIKNTVILLPMRDEGIEARVALAEEEMGKFLQDPELLAFLLVGL